VAYKGAAVLYRADLGDVVGSIDCRMVRRRTEHSSTVNPNPPWKALALKASARSPGSQSFWISFGMVMPAALRFGITSLQK
jgi:hypothetical protein